jgi:hypothetical protein
MDFILILHNAMRWVVVVVGLYALVRMFMGMFQKSEFSESDRKSLSWFAITLDIQLLLGLVLYIANGWWRVFQNMSNAMGQASVRFFAVEHISLMIVAWILAHLAVVFVKRAPSSVGKFRRGAIFVTLTALAIFFAIPWPWTGDYGRPLFRLAEALLVWFV